MLESHLHFMELPSPWPQEPGLVRLPFPPPDASAEEIVQRLRQGTLEQPYILETETERRLHFSHEYTQSVMSLRDPDALVVSYTRKMMSFLLFSPNPWHITMIGLGGGSLVKFCHRHLHQTKISVTEVDPRVIALRDEFRIPLDDHRLQVVHDDGARHLPQLAHRTDVIIVDAFDADGIDESLATTGFYMEAMEHLSSNGLIVMNLSGETSRYARHLKHIRSAVPGRMLLVPVADDENTLLFAFKREIKFPTVMQYQSRAKELQSRLSLDFSRFLNRLCQSHTFK